MASGRKTRLGGLIFGLQRVDTLSRKAKENVGFGAYVAHADKERSRMKNVEMTVEGSILTIKVDLSQEFGPSASGKTVIVATTEGNVPLVGRDEKVGLNIYRKRTPSA
jgi:hypothetical protein